MIADLSPYPEYKESGLPWLGHVPGHWDMQPTFGAFVPNHERNLGMKEKTVLSLSYGRIIIKTAEKLHGLVPESFETYQIVNPGDIVLRTTDLQNDHTSLRVGMVRDRGIITSAYLALRVKAGVSPDFGWQFLNVWDMSKAIYGYGSGLRQNLDFSHFKRMPVALPPPSEQAAIVRFLDWANGRLERAIRAKRKVIALLTEQKQAIIHRAVTRGLDASVPLKPSGIPWLGDIPQHWEVQRLKRVCRVQGGYAFPSSIFGDRGVSVVRMNNLRRGVLDLNGAVRIPESECVPVFALQPGDILYGLSGSIGSTGSLGNYAIVSNDDLPAMLNQRVARFVPKRDKIQPSFLVQLIQTHVFYEQVLADTTGTAQFNVSTNDIENVAVALPPLNEQENIVSQIAKEVEPIVAAITRLEREIDLVREYRTRLVADVVTGKLDVREVAARVPDGTEDPEPVDEADSMTDAGEDVTDDLDTVPEESRT
jgi:type I restriction enzyme, S subunit